MGDNNTTPAMINLDRATSELKRLKFELELPELFGLDIPADINERKLAEIDVTLDMLGAYQDGLSRLEDAPSTEFAKKYITDAGSINSDNLKLGLFWDVPRLYERVFPSGSRGIEVNADFFVRAIEIEKKGYKRASFEPPLSKSELEVIDKGYDKARKLVEGGSINEGMRALWDARREASMILARAKQDHYIGTDWSDVVCDGTAMAAGIALTIAAKNPEFMKIIPAWFAIRGGTMVGMGIKEDNADLVMNGALMLSATAFGAGARAAAEAGLPGLAFALHGTEKLTSAYFTYEMAKGIYDAAKDGSRFGFNEQNIHDIAMNGMLLGLGQVSSLAGKIRPKWDIRSSLVAAKEFLTDPVTGPFGLQREAGFVDLGGKKGHTEPAKIDKARLTRYSVEANMLMNGGREPKGGWFEPSVDAETHAKWDRAISNDIYGRKNIIIAKKIGYVLSRMMKDGHPLTRELIKEVVDTCDHAGLSGGGWHLVKLYLSAVWLHGEMFAKTAEPSLYEPTAQTAKKGLWQTIKEFFTGPVGPFGPNREGGFVDLGGKKDAAKPNGVKEVTFEPTEEGSWVKVGVLRNHIGTDRKPYTTDKVAEGFNDVPEQYRRIIPSSDGPSRSSVLLLGNIYFQQIHEQMGYEIGSYEVFVSKKTWPLLPQGIKDAVVQRRASERDARPQPKPEIKPRSTPKTDVDGVTLESQLEGVQDVNGLPYVKQRVEFRTKEGVSDLNLANRMNGTVTPEALEQVRLRIEFFKKIIEKYEAIEAGQQDYRMEQFIIGIEERLEGYEAGLRKYGEMQADKAAGTAKPVANDEYSPLADLSKEIEQMEHPQDSEAMKNAYLTVRSKTANDIFWFDQAIHVKGTVPPNVAENMNARILFMQRLVEKCDSQRSQETEKLKVHAEQDLANAIKRLEAYNRR